MSNTFERAASRDLTESERMDRDWQMERRAEQSFRRETANDTWNSYQENWVEMTEFLGPKKPASSQQMELGFEEVA